MTDLKTAPSKTIDITPTCHENVVSAENPALVDYLNQQLASATGCQRILHGRGRTFKHLHAVNIEWYPPYLFVQNFDSELPSFLKAALEQVFEHWEKIDAVLVQNREWPDFMTSVLLSRVELELPLKYAATLAGYPSDDESDKAPTDNSDDLVCEVSLGKNRNTGVFLDMRAGWSWLQNNAQGKRVLNLFSYTGVFSLFALKGGATRVDNVDMAANVLKIAQRNHQLNKVHDGQSAFYKRDILKSQRWFESRTPYDIIIIDPPPYQKKAFHGWKDYTKLLRNCRLAIADGGIMFCCLNNPQASIEEFMAGLKETFPDAIGFSVIARAPEILEQEESKGLKTIAVQF
jgi:23S rRNA (cytosine1962-C5)-methyltransferase